MKVALRLPNVLGQCCANVIIYLYTVIVGLTLDQHDVFEISCWSHVGPTITGMHYYDGATLPQHCISNVRQTKFVDVVPHFYVSQQMVISSPGSQPWHTKSC